MNSEHITFQLPSILLREKRFLLVAQPARKDRARETGNLQLPRLKGSCGDACIGPFPSKGGGCSSRSSPASLPITQCQRTLAHSWPSDSPPPVSGDACFGAAARRMASRGNGSRRWRPTFFRTPYPFTPGLASVLLSNTRGGSRMRESRPYGSVRGASSNGRPTAIPNVWRSYTCHTNPHDVDFWP